jgi:hypothetical protein
VSCSLPTLFVGTYPTSIRFQAKREMPETQPLPSTSSTWTLVTSDGKTDGKTEPRSDPSVGDPQVDGHKPQGRPNPSVKDSVVRDGKSLPQTEGKPSRLKRTGRRLKGFIKSKSVLTLQKCRDGLHPVGRNIWSKAAGIGIGVGAAGRSCRVESTIYPRDPFVQHPGPRRFCCDSYVDYS